MTTMNAEQPPQSGRAIVLCLDGTANEPETGITNVARMFDVAVKDDQQLAFYHPGVGTMGARGAFTPTGRALSRAAGLVAGFGIKDNIEQAYTYLMRNYRPDDRIFVFGFSRGAYTARALTGMLRTVGLLRPGAENLVPYAVKLYTRAGKIERVLKPNAEGADTNGFLDPDQKEFWALRDDFTRCFGNPMFPSRFSNRKQVHFLGVWDTVKSVGWLNWRGQYQQARWPYTAKITNVNIARQALAIDERRRPYLGYRFDADAVATSGGRYEEMWFAGVHSDIGGQFADDHVLSDIAFTWILEEATAAGFRFRSQVYKRMVGLKYGAAPGPDSVNATLHGNKWWWVLAGGWRHRVILPGDAVHPTVRARIAGTADGPHPYRPRLP
jgi:uncharacterized protein (DUF2235 family)